MTAAGRRPRHTLAALLLVGAALGWSACGSSDTRATTGAPASSPAPPTSSTPGPSPSRTVEQEATPILSPAEQAAWKVYEPDPFHRLNLSGFLYGDDFGLGPLTEVIDLCGTTVAPASTPVAAARAVSSTGGSLAEDDPGQVTRSVAVYPTDAGAETTYQALLTGLTACSDTHSETITLLDFPDGLGWRRTGYQEDQAKGAEYGGVAQVWIVTQHRRTLLVQYESFPTGISASQATRTADRLFAKSAQVRERIAPAD